MKNSLYVILLTSLFFTSCNTVKNTKLNNYLFKSNCNQQSVYSYKVSDLPVSVNQILIDSLITKSLSFKSINAANAIGILDLLSQYYNKEQSYLKKPSLENKVDLLALSEKIGQRINFASLEVSAVSSELDCEEERTDQIATYLENLESENESKLTVGAIVVGASSAIAAGFFINSDSKTPEYIGLGTGIAEAALGMAILVNKKKIEFFHERNVLREVWEGKSTSSVFPAFIWYFLNFTNQKDEFHVSVRNQIIDRWTSFGQISEEDKTDKKQKLIDLYFGNGGKYTSEQLKNRANMLDQLESNVNLLKQDLKTLAVEFEKSQIAYK